MQKYTAVLLRPDYLAEQYGIDTYVATVEADSMKGAVEKAQEEVFQADSADGMHCGSADDYALVLLFHDHITPILYGWQLQ